MTDEMIISRLERPAETADVILDTDAFNEVDDQFALAYMLKVLEKLNVKAIYAAPFMNERVESPKEGMEKSFAEIQNILSLCGRKDMKSVTYRGSEAFLSDENTPIVSDAAKDMVKRALAQPNDRPLYIIAIGAITNVASALLLNPFIAEKIVVVWLGGHARSWPDTREFNLFQDVASARVVFSSGVPLVQLPCMGVVSHLSTTGPELKSCLSGKNELCDYLYNIVINEMAGQPPCWSRIIWDISAIAWMLGDQYTSDIIVPGCMPTYEGLYEYSGTKPPMKYVNYVNRDLIFRDLFEKLTLM